MRDFLRTELSNTLKLAIPVVIAQVGFTVMGVVDTIMVGRLDAADLGAVGAARSVFWLVAVFSMGTLGAMDALASQAHGAKNEQRLGRLLFEGFAFATLLSILCTPVVLTFARFFHIFQSVPEITVRARSYLAVAGLGLPFILWFTVLGRYWQARGVTMPIVGVLILGNVVNYFANRALIFGDFGFSAMGLAGAAWATNLSRALIFSATLVFTIYSLWGRVRIREGIRLVWRESQSLWDFLKLGAPAGLQQFFEFSAFSATTLLAATLGPTQAATHQVAIILVSFTYMFSVGFSNSAAIRVGHIAGSGDIALAKKAGWLNISLACLIMAAAAVAFLLVPQQIVRFFTPAPDVVALGVQILFWAAMFQVVDAIQIGATGCLRGLGNTRKASWVNAIGHYPIGLFSGAVLCFGFGMGLPGLWVGLCVGLSFIAIVLLWAWATMDQNELASGPAGVVA